jgi:hypothetical protein
LAGNALSAAKNAERGERSAIAWLDVTADGATGAGIRGPVRTDVLTAARAGLGRLAELPASTRQTITGHGRSPDTVFQADMTRLGLRDVVGPFTDKTGLPLATALEVTRWWT